MQQRVMRGVAIVAALLLATACVRESLPLTRIHAADGVVDVATEVVSTPEALMRGLMYRSELPDGHGMLFVFPEERDHQFWMKNTLIPLDMIFIGADAVIVGIHANAVPLSTATVGVGRPSRYVLEVPGGWSARRGVAAGQRVEIPEGAGR
jgi:uncharacterized membrane protein (UPF0127 family)